MRKKLSLFLVTGLALVFASFCCRAQNSSTYCGIVLESGAFNKTDYSKSTSLIMAKINDVCSQEYESQQAAVSAGRSAGGSLGYGGVSIGLSDAKQKSQSKWSISDSKLCLNSQEQLNSQITEHEKNQITDQALKTWLNCIETTNKNQLYISYENSPDGREMTGTIHRKVTGEIGSFGKLKGIQANAGTKSDDIKCTVENRNIDIGENKEFVFTKTRTAISCTKKDVDKNIKISLVTDQGDTDWINMPSPKKIEETSISSMKTEISKLKIDLLSLQKDAQLNKDSISSFGSNVDNKISSIKFPSSRIVMTKSIYFSQRDGWERFNNTCYRKIEAIHPKDNTMCGLNSVSGKFIGDGEFVSVSIEGDNWVFRGNSCQQGVSATVTCHSIVSN